MTSRRLVVCFCLSFAIALIGALPLSIVLKALGPQAHEISYSHASGTVWSGRLEQLHWRGYGLGSAEVGLRPFALMLGRLALDIRLDGRGAVQGGGRIVLTALGTLRLLDVTLTANVAHLPALLPVTGTISIAIKRAEMAAGECRMVEGTVRTDALVRQPAGLPWTGPVLSGAMGCDNGVLRVPLEGETGDDMIDVVMQIVRDGTFGIDVNARTSNNTVSKVLTAAGFTESAGTMTLTQKGRWMPAARR